MRGFIGGIMVGIVIGVIIAAKVPQNHLQNQKNYNKNYADAPEVSEAPVRLNFASDYPLAILLNKKLGLDVVKRLEKVSNRNIVLKFQKSAATDPKIPLFDAVSSGAIDAALSSSQLWTDKSVAFGLFSSVPFGPDIVAYLTWFRQHGGRAFYDKLYLKHNIKSMICGMTGAAGAGWFNQKINTIEDLRKSTIAANGLVLNVYENIGASVVKLVPIELVSLLKNKKINAVAFSSPAMDQQLGLSKYSKYYYFPSWFQQAKFIDLMINLKKWEKLDETKQKIIETTCMANVVDSISASESVQFDTLKEIINDGIDVREFSPEVMRALKQAWLSVSSAYSRSNNDFRQILDSLRKFRADYSIWQDLGKI